MKSLSPLCLLIVILSICGCDESGQGPVATKSQPSSEPLVFDWGGFLPTPNPTDADWNEIISSGLRETHESLRGALVNNTITPHAARGFEAIMDEPDRLTRIQKALLELDGPNRTLAIQRLYRELMLARPNPDVLYAHLRYQATRSLDLARSHSHQGGRYIGWGLSTTNDASVIAFEATGDARFLSLLSDSLHAALALRDSEHGRIDAMRDRAMPSWGGTRYDEHERYTTNITLAGRSCFSMLRFVEIVRSDSALQERFGSDAELFLNAAITCIDAYTDDFRLIDGTDDGYYQLLTHGVAEPLNHMAGAGNSLIILHKLTGKDRYGRMARQLANFFRHSMWTDEHGSLAWEYWPTAQSRRRGKAEHTWKARITVQFPVFAHRRGVGFDEDDMKGIAQMFTRNIHRGGGHFSALIDGQWKDMEQYDDNSSGYLCFTPFILYDEHDPAIRDVIEELVASRPDAGGWLRATYGVLAYAHRLQSIRWSTD
jgi:hypothetical protein